MRLFIRLSPAFFDHERKHNAWSPRLDGKLLNTNSAPEIYGFRPLSFCVQQTGRGCKYKTTSALIDRPPAQKSSLIQHGIYIGLSECPDAIYVREYKKLGPINIGRIAKTILGKAVLVSKGWKAFPSHAHHRVCSLTC
jgi:hypothetical protein